MEFVLDLDLGVIVSLSIVFLVIVIKANDLKNKD